MITRDTSFGYAVTFWNYLDGKLIGETKGKTYFVTFVKPGQHYVVVTTENAAVANIDFQPGKPTDVPRSFRADTVWKQSCQSFAPDSG